MKKNVVYIIIDAFCFDSLKHKISGNYVTPFLNNLMENAICFNNMYTQAPYTEASQVTLLSNENVLENGGYLLGNGNTQNSVLEKYSTEGYNTIFSYSPYIYSKAYLRGVKDYYYTRLYSIKPLLLYRLEYYKNKQVLKTEEKKICELLVSEALETWIAQCNSIINKDESAKLITQLQTNIKLVEKTRAILLKEKEKFDKTQFEYVSELLKKWEAHTLYLLNDEYIKIKRSSLNYEKYKSKLEKFQRKYTKIARKQKIDFNYLFGQLFREKEKGLRKFINLLKSYIGYYTNKDLTTYFENINYDNKPEVSMKRLFETYKEKIIDYDSNDELYYAYIHVQDFHLPSVFHTFDCFDERELEKEMDWAFNLLSQIDKTYKGNIIADLSAHYCDKMIESFFNDLQKNCKNDFLFVITADHGYPSYYTPPRPMIYNQTYSEAFHIPYIVMQKNTTNKFIHNNFFSTLDTMKIIDSIMLDKYEMLQGRKYILSEYGGPGAPVINEKEIWYTYIDEKYRVSVRCMLNDEITEKRICDLINLKNDKYEKFNKAKDKHELKNIEYIIKIIATRHKELNTIFSGEKFYMRITL